jgi:plastocyanin
MQAFTEHLGAGNRVRAAVVATMAGAAALLLLKIGDGVPASASPTAAASKSVTVTIKGFKYKPSTINIGKGDRVVWANLDSVKHTATRGGSFTTGKIKPGKAVAVKFGSKGTYRYHCTLHPEMTGKVVVGG